MALVFGAPAQASVKVTRFEGWHLVVSKSRLANLCAMALSLRAWGRAAREERQAEAQAEALLGLAAIPERTADIVNAETFLNQGTLSARANEIFQLIYKVYVPAHRRAYQKDVYLEDLGLISPKEFNNTDFVIDEARRVAHDAQLFLDRIEDSLKQETISRFEAQYLKKYLGYHANIWRSVTVRLNWIENEGAELTETRQFTFGVLVDALK